MTPDAPNPNITTLLDGDKTIEELPFTFIYEIPTISERWDTINDLAALTRFAQDHRALAQDWQTANGLLTDHSRWDGDTMNGPTPILVPNGPTWAALGWVVQQAKGGWTYVITRIPLPWLRVHAEELIELEYDDPPRIQA